MNKEVEYLKEHLYEIYKYKKSMKDLTYDMDIEHLLRTCKALDYSQKEIERLNNIIDEADTKNLELIQKINKIYDVIENKNITGIEARLLIQDMLDKEE